MSRNKYTVMLNGQGREIIYADRYEGGAGGAAFFNRELGDARLELVAEFREVVGVLRDCAYQPSEAIPAEPNNFPIGVSSVFLSPSNPLIEAIESTTRLISELEMREVERVPGNVSALTTLGPHLDVLLAEQLRAVIVPRIT